MTISGAQFVTIILIRLMLKRLVRHLVLEVVHILLSIQNFPSQRFQFGWIMLTVPPATGYDNGGRATAATTAKASAKVSATSSASWTQASRNPVRQTFWNAIIMVGVTKIVATVKTFYSHVPNKPYIELETF